MLGPVSLPASPPGSREEVEIWLLFDVMVLILWSYGEKLARKIYKANVGPFFFSWSNLVVRGLLPTQNHEK